MKLESITLANYGGFERLDITLEPEVTVIAGVNGVGKSTLLRAMGVLLSNTQRRLGVTRARPIPLKSDDVFGGAALASLSASMDFDSRKVRAELSVRPNPRPIKKFDLFGAISGGSPNACLAVYFSPKRQFHGQPRSLPEAKPFEPSFAYGGALQDREVELREFMHWFRTQDRLGMPNEPRRRHVLEAMRRVVTELMPEFSNLRIEDEPRLAFVVEKCGKPFYVHQLSDGERSLLALVFDLTRRLAIANPDSEDPIGKGMALVLIDEIELHLHPKWQRDVLQRLRDIFKACQFVVTTHSPLVLGEVPARCVRFLEVMERKVRVVVPTEAYGMDANRILHEFMDAPVRNRRVDDELKSLFKLIDREHFDEARSAIVRLEDKLGQDEPELTRASSLIRFLEGAE